MARNGNILTGPLPVQLDFSKAQLVLVTGTFPNTCGHMLIYFKGVSLPGLYFHFDGPRLFDKPKFMTSHEYFEYIRYSHKEELIRKDVSLPNPDGARIRLMQLMHGNWLSFLTAHNCASFVKTIINNGGNFWAFSERCPVLGMGLNTYIEENFKR